MAKNRFDSGRGPTQRQLRVGEAIRRALSEVLARGEIHDPELAQISVTVGEVRTSADYRVATAYVLPLGGQNADELVKILARNKFEIRRAVTKLVNLKHSPEIRFMADRTYDQIDETNRLLNLDDVRRDLDRPAEE